MHMQLAFVLNVLLQGSKICFPQHQARSIAASFASQQMLLRTQMRAEVLRSGETQAGVMKNHLAPLVKVPNRRRPHLRLRTERSATFTAHFCISATSLVTSGATQHNGSRCVASLTQSTES